MSPRRAWFPRPSRRGRSRIAFGAVAVLAGIAFFGVGPLPLAHADEPVDQITGNGTTASAVTVSWAQGLVGADNHTAVSTRDPASPYTFMYPDFQNLVVSVSQTQHIVHQAISVTWSGGLPTQNPFKSNFLQMMQCYGDATTGPTPEQCEYGSFGLLPAGVPNPGIGGRTGSVCATRTPNVDNPPGSVDGSGPGLGCDPAEPSVGTHTPPCPTGICLGGNYSVPFTPVDSTDLVYGTTTEFYDQYNTNEVQQASTGVDGTGQQFFQTLTATEAPGLGCGQPRPDGSGRGCWLVIVPRGSYEPNGWNVDGQGGTVGFMNESPLGAASWAQRIQIHLDFDPQDTSCPIGSAKERQMVGTELVSRAVFSWQLALNATSNCERLFGYSATPEATDTTQLVGTEGTAGLAFTTVPIGDELVRDGSTPPKLPRLVYAPMTASAITFGFNINQPSGVITGHIKLTPRLVAKALTQSYRFDLPDVDSNHPGPTWAAKNPDFITRDPEFLKLNPGIVTPASGSPLAPLLTEDHSGVNQQVWAWLLADPAAKAWLNGAPDEFGTVVNPAYAGLHLTRAALDSYPRADPTCFNTGGVGEPTAGRCSLDLLSYVHNFDDAATHVRAANNPLGASWDPSKLSPTQTAGWWANGGVEPPGRIFIWGVMSSADLANLGLVPADLCSDDGTTCVAPSTSSVTTALDTAKPDRAGILRVNPGAPGVGGYPLVTVSYAVIRATQDAAALRDYADLIMYAAGQGQTPGVDPGQLPRGYLPLPLSMQFQARAAAAKLLSLAAAQPSTSPSPTGHPSTHTTGPNPPGPPGQPVIVPPTTPADNPTPYTTTRSVRVADEPTPAVPMGPVRWVLVAVVVAGLAGAAGGPLIRGRRS